MKVAGVPYRSVWRETDRVAIIDQTRLPFEFQTLRLSGCDEIAHAIRSMQVRGAPLIGATAAYGIALAMSVDTSDANLQLAAKLLGSTRPTAVNLGWAIERMTRRLLAVALPARAETAWTEAGNIADEDIAFNLSIGHHGLTVLRDIADRKGKVNVLTHCNAGWLATVDVGTALAPIYLAHDAGIPLHVWVDETRPRNQGLLTAWELSQHGVPNTLITDNAGGHLMQQGQVDVVIVGADRVTAAGDVCNKIGTYLKALAAKDCSVPFYAAVPSPTIDWSIHDAFRDIPIEERSAAEVTTVRALDAANLIVHARIAPDETHAANPAFDVTPARLVTAIITDRGIAPANREGLHDLYRKKGRLSMTELQLRKQIMATALRMNSLGINRGKSGNVSARWKDGFLITPSGLPYEDTKPSDIVFIDAKAKPQGKRPPSSEWRFHFDIYHRRSEVSAVVHTHSSFATTLACLDTGVPAFHYMVAVAGGNSIRCAPYATFGTQLLSDHALGALEDRKACLLANHGMIATGDNLRSALALAVEVEALCEQYWRALQIGKPILLPDDEMALVVEKFKTYNAQAR